MMVSWVPRDLSPSVTCLHSTSLSHLFGIGHPVVFKTEHSEVKEETLGHRDQSWRKPLEIGRKVGAGESLHCLAPKQSPGRAVIALGF